MTDQRLMTQPTSDTSPNVQKHPLTIAVAVAIVAFMLVGTLYMMRKADARTQPVDDLRAATAVPVDVHVLEPVALPRQIEARGYLSGIDEVIVHGEAAGRVQARRVGDGESLSAGEVILEIDDTFYRLGVERAEAELRRTRNQVREAVSAVTQAEAQLRAADAVLADRIGELERIERLLEDDHAADVEHTRMRTALRTAEAERAAAEASLARARDMQSVADSVVRVAEATLDEARARLERCVVRAPISGRINRVLLEEGEYVIAGAPVAEIVRLDQMKMIIELADTEVPMLEMLEQASVVADAAADHTYGGELSFVAPKMDPRSRKFQVELTVDNGDGRLLSGMYGTAVLRCGSIGGVRRIPGVAVFKHYGADHCLVVASVDGVDRAVLRSITVQSIPGRLDDLAVVSGLEDGDRVIVSRRRELHHDVPVTVGRVVNGDDDNDGVLAGNAP
jgi:multidrug efflux pump subunit AcrA (membrane-fusion protein)